MKSVQQMGQIDKGFCIELYKARAAAQDMYHDTT